LQLHDNHGSDHVLHVLLGKFSVTISEDDIQALSNTGSTTSLALTSMRDAVHVFINGKLAGLASLSSSCSGFSQDNNSNKSICL
jgi:hypothetical protein